MTKLTGETEAKCTQDIFDVRWIGARMLRDAVSGRSGSSREEEHFEEMRGSTTRRRGQGDVGQGSSNIHGLNSMALECWLYVTMHSSKPTE